jgi:hypothetical protein
MRPSYEIERLNSRVQWVFQGSFPDKAQARAALASFRQKWPFQRWRLLRIARSGREEVLSD